MFWSSSVNTQTILAGFSKVNQLGH